MLFILRKRERFYHEQSACTLDATQERVPVPALLQLPTTLSTTPETQALLLHLHRLNVLATYRELEKIAASHHH
jgi:hypothetical protein